MIRTIHLQTLESKILGGCSYCSLATHSFTVPMVELRAQLIVFKFVRFFFDFDKSILFGNSKSLPTYYRFSKTKAAWRLGGLNLMLQSVIRQMRRDRGRTYNEFVFVPREYNRVPDRLGRIFYDTVKAHKASKLNPEIFILRMLHSRCLFPPKMLAH